MERVARRIHLAAALLAALVSSGAEPTLARPCPKNRRPILAPLYCSHELPASLQNLRPDSPYNSPGSQETLATLMRCSAGLRCSTGVDFCAGDARLPCCRADWAVFRGPWCLIFPRLSRLATENIRRRTSSSSSIGSCALGKRTPPGSTCAAIACQLLRTAADKIPGQHLARPSKDKTRACRVSRRGHRRSPVEDGIGAASPVDLQSERLPGWPGLNCDDLAPTLCGAITLSRATLPWKARRRLYGDCASSC
jgi:hypothetical protein